MKYAISIIIAVALVAVSVWVYRKWAQQETQPSATGFRMPIEDAFALKVPGKVVVVGKIVEGEVRAGDRLTIKMQNEAISVEVEALEALGEPIDVGRSGKHVGIMLIGATKEQIRQGAVLVK